MLRPPAPGAALVALDLRHSNCVPPATFAVDSILAFVDGSIAIVAFSQLLRIHLCNRQLGWTRQKIFHLMIGTSNFGFLLYFTGTLLATCNRWLCWSHGCGFVLMACPQILFLASFLLLLSFWVDLCHQASDEDDEEYTEALLEKKRVEAGSSRIDRGRRRCGFFSGHIGSRQKFVILVMLLTFIFMIAFAVLIWIGKGKNPIDSSLMAKVYLDIFSIAIFLLGGALACYGGLLFSKMSKVRSERASTEMWKVASLAAVTLVCFTVSALVALISSAPVLYDHKADSYKTSSPVPLFLYYFFGSTVPSVFVLWIMREMPRQAIERETRSRVVTFVRGSSSSNRQSQSRTSSSTSSKQPSKASPV
ncbi:tobamovirus multiplication protein [Wolffia australiana]